MTLLQAFDPSASAGASIPTTLGTNPGVLLCLNDSATNIYIQTADGQQHLLPAQVWRRIDVAAQNASVQWVRINILPMTVPNSQVYIEVLTVEEAKDIPDVFPAAIVRATTINAGSNLVAATLSNESAVTGALVIDTGTLLNPAILRVFNDHFIFTPTIVTAGAPVNAISGGDIPGAATSNVIVQLAAAGFVAEVVGSLQIDQQLMLQQSATAPVLASNGTITTANLGITRVAPAAAVTGIIMQAGTLPGQMVILINESATANSITFAASGSNVSTGSSVVQNGGRGAWFAWDSSTNLWYVV